MAADHNLTNRALSRSIVFEYSRGARTGNQEREARSESAREPPVLLACRNFHFCCGEKLCCKPSSLFLPLILSYSNIK